MITAIIRNKENTLVLELPHSIYDIYEKLRSIGIMQPPKRIPLTDNEDEDIGVKLFSESDFGQHLLLTLHEKNSIADANMLTLVIGAASEDIKEELEQNILYDQYDSMDEVISAVHLAAEHGNQYAAQLIHSIRVNGNWTAALASLRLLGHMARVIQNRLEDERRGRENSIDRKLRRKIEEKKQAHGLKQ